MRLIDADKIKQSVTNEMFKAELHSPVYNTLECVITDIDNQPTAFDLESVIQQLEEKIIEEAGIDKSRLSMNREEYSSYCLLTLADVIEILNSATNATNGKIRG